MTDPIPSEFIYKRLEFTFGYRHLSLLASASIFLVIVLGVISGAVAGNGCPDWPACQGVLLPPGGLLLPDYLHRLAVVLSFLLVCIAVFGAFRQRPRQTLIVLPVLVSLIILIVQSLLGGLFSLRSSPLFDGLHIGLALIALSASWVSTTAAFLARSGDLVYRTPAWRSPFARLSLLVFVLVFVLLISGSLVAASGATIACDGWPLCNGQLFPASLLGRLNMLHRFIVGFSSLAVLVLLVQAWRTQRSNTAILVSTTAVAVLYFSQSVMGARNATLGYPPHLLGLHAATSAAIWGVLTLLVTLTGLSGSTAAREYAESSSIHDRKITSLLTDFLLLTKPIVVALLLVTTLAGMVIGAKAWPSFSLAFWTLFGGFLAAGGSGAINQFIDREDDERMQRTSGRPIPSGRLTPAEGLAFGVAASLVSFYLMTAFVNFFAALLSLAGIFYYVILYSLILKKTTVQNIVIGGGAGAIPPLVGWAAATGSLTFPSLLLFAVVFMWTPPHFWALALVRRNDYARAGVPMLPVVRGSKETRWQVFLYTLELVVLTLVLPILGLGNSIYFVSALVLGGLLIFSAYRVWKIDGNKVAWKMYRHSSMYLAFLFLALMLDRLIL